LRERLQWLNQHNERQNWQCCEFFQHNVSPLMTRPLHHKAHEDMIDLILGVPLEPFYAAPPVTHMIVIMWQPLIHRWRSCIRMATTTPEMNVSAAIEPIAHARPKKSAMSPADNAPIA